MNEQMKNRLEDLKAAFSKDYREFNKDRSASPHVKKMMDDYEASITYKVGKKYIKIYRERHGVLGFIVNTEDDKKFPYGTMLKPASFKTPMRNFSRGNIFDQLNVKWTGI